MSTRTKLIIGAAVMAAFLVGCPPQQPPSGEKKDQAKATTTTTQAQKKGGQVAAGKGGQVAVELYIMSKCPYGARTAGPMIDAIKKLGSAVDFKLDYIVTPQGDDFRSLHGPTEVRGNIDQLCAKKVGGDKYMAFVQCVSKNYRDIPNNTEQCAKEAGIDFGALKTCAEGPEGKSLLRESAARAQAAGARGSPTIKIGGKSYRGGRGTRDFMRAICAAAKDPKPKACAEIPPPVKVNMIVLTDKRCKDCRTARYEAQLKSYFPGLEVKTVDYDTPEGKELYQKTGVKFLPALLFDESVTKAEAYAQFARRFNKVGDYYQIRVRAKFDPTAEICDNKKDDTGNGLVDCDDPTCKQTLTCREEKKGELAVFVMSQCPYGVRALNAMKEVFGALGDNVKFSIHYIADKTPTGFRSLHGQGEVDEDIRELCAIKHYAKDRKYMEYIWCRNKDIRSKDWEKCTGSNGISADVIRKCAEGEEGKKLLEEDIKIAQALQIGASPTWLANNKYKFSGIQPERIKSSFCKHNPGTKGCDKKLSTQVDVPKGACGK